MDCLVFAQLPIPGHIYLAAFHFDCRRSLNGQLIPICNRRQPEPDPRFNNSGAFGRYYRQAIFLDWILPPIWNLLAFLWIGWYSYIPFVLGIPGGFVQWSDLEPGLSIHD